MNPRVARVFRGYRSLSDADRRELLEAIHESQRPGGMDKTARDLDEALKRVNTGPYAESRCDCCGR